MKNSISFLLLSLLVCGLTLPSFGGIGGGFCGGSKSIYIPDDLRDMNLESDTSQWCWQRSAETRDLIFLWERGFGNDLQNPPQLEGKPMSFNLSVLMSRVQSFYTFFRDTLSWISPPLSERQGENSSKSDRYKMMVMIMYSLEGTAYGGTYDNFIGALWVAPNRIQDNTMNCMAHELGHSFQLQIPADSVGEAWGGSGFYEMTSQWMLWQVNPCWLRDENYHFEAFKTLTHKAFLAMDNIYHSPYVIQWWSDLHGRKSIAQLYREGRIGEDPVITYKRLYHMTQEQFCDEMFQGYQHLVNFDFSHARQETRPYACTWQTPLDTLPSGWLRPKTTLEDYGFHIISLPANQRISIKVKGEHVRWGLVGITADEQTIFGQPQAPSLKSKNKNIVRQFLVVMGAPTEHTPLYRHSEEEPRQTTQPKQYPYEFRIR